MKTKKKISLILILIIFVLICGTLLMVKFLKHEKWQSVTINNLVLQNQNLTEQVSLLNNNLVIANKAIDELKQQIVQSDTKYIDNGFNYLAIGNSITKHEKCDYWWNEIGMAATEEEKDYFHLVSSYLKSKNDNFYSAAINYSVWETNANDRAQTFNMIEPYLSDKLNLVTIQLSENAGDLSTFQSDYTELINHIKEKCPEAQILLVDDFWSNEKSNLKKEIASSNNISFVDLSEIRGMKEYQCGMNTIVYGDDGKENKVEHEGVAAHPGDKGMKFIADAIINMIK